MKEIETRRSIRKYTGKKVEKEALMQILESARLAPSGSNTQPWYFIIVELQEIKEKIVAADHDQKWMLTAPVFIVCVADICCRLEPKPNMFIDEESPEPEVKMIIRDTAITIEHILLEAEHLGLSTCWTAWFDQKDMRPAMNIPNDKYVVGVITLGYADENPAQRPRRKMEDIIRYEKWA